MGEVHLARDIKFDRLVALKFFRENPHDAAARDRFLREATMAGRLVHPHIVTIYDFGEHGNELYIAMEYIAGETLAILIRRHEPESLHERIRLAIELCSGLATAHDAGVLHRDIKPENLMLAPSGGLKILDFGIARALESAGTVTFIGSLHYMSPEQLTHAPLDARSDIFAVGAVLYEMLSFEQAFPATSIDGVIQEIRFRPHVPLGERCPGLDASLIAIVDRALQKAPEARFADCRAMERELRSVLRRLPAEDGDMTAPIVAAAPAITPDRSTQTFVLPANVQTRWALLQARLLDAHALRDYVWLALAGAVPLIVAGGFGAYRDIPLDRASLVYDACVAAMGPNPIVQGYGSRLNWWPYFAVLPLALFLLRRTAARLFPLPGVRDIKHVGILRKISPLGRSEVAARLASAALDPRNLAVAFGLAAVITLVDLRETFAYYAAAASGGSLACPREFDWTVRFLAGPPLSITANVLLLLVAYPCQIVGHALGLMLFGLLFRHNAFYLEHIYQRYHGLRYPLEQQIALEFDDVERCFGLRELHATFNYQVLLLILGGMLVLASRLMNVDATPIGVQYEAALAAMLPGVANGPPVGIPRIGVADLFPDAGQVMLGMAWMACFLIVAMPSLVKFLPLIHKHLKLVGRREYLLEFIPPTTDVHTDTQEAVDRLAMKFARSSFWPAGDERARTLYTIAYLVFFIVLIPVPPTSNVAQAMHLIAVFVLALAGMKVTFWLFRKALTNIDATLAQP